MIMDEMLKITKNILSKIFSVIKSDINTVKTSVDDKDKYILAVALQGKEITSYRGNSVPIAARKIGNLLYKMDTNQYGYWNSKFVALSIGDILKTINTNEFIPIRRYWKVSSSLWTTATPFNILNGVVTDIYKGETVGGNTKWILIPYKDTETQTYTAGITANLRYYGSYDYDPNHYAAPWELWLPSDLGVKTVVVDW